MPKKPQLKMSRKNHKGETLWMADTGAQRLGALHIANPRRGVWQVVGDFTARDLHTWIRQTEWLMDNGLHGVHFSTCAKAKTALTKALRAAAKAPKKEQETASE